MSAHSSTASRRSSCSAAAPDREVHFAQVQKVCVELQVVGDRAYAVEEHGVAWRWPSQRSAKPAAVARRAAMADGNDRVGHYARRYADDPHAPPPLRYRRGGRGKDGTSARVSRRSSSGQPEPRARPGERAMDENEAQTRRIAVGSISQNSPPPG
jgi:hypothetical protein